MFAECITTVKAYDPDKLTREEDQEIEYSIVTVVDQPMISINKEGCMRILLPLNRDPPDGYPVYGVNFFSFLRFHLFDLQKLECGVS